MSGGHWEYKQYEFQRMADDVEVMILNNNSLLTEETLKKFKDAAYYMRMAFSYASAIDYLLSDDYSEKSFNKVVDYQSKQINEAFRRKLKEAE